MPHISTNDVTAFRDAWRAAELDTSIADRVDVALERIAGIYRETQACTEHAPTEWAKIVADIAAGAITIGQGVERLRSEALRPEDHSQAQTLMSAAVDRTLRDLVDDLRARNIAPVIELANSTILAEVQKLASAIVDIHDDAASLRAPRPQREAWAQCTADHDRHAAVVEAATRAARLHVAEPNIRWPEQAFEEHGMTDRQWRAMAPAQRIVLIATPGASPHERLDDAEYQVT